MAGVNTDQDLEKAKGPTILKVHEREAIMSSVKWVDEMAHDNPYDVDQEDLDRVNCKFYVHGDDPCYNAQGEDMNEILASIGRFKLIKRTTGISTTDITGRLLKLLEPDTPVGLSSANNLRFAEPPKQ